MGGAHAPQLATEASHAQSSKDMSLSVKTHLPKCRAATARLPLTVSQPGLDLNNESIHLVQISPVLVVIICMCVFSSRQFYHVIGYMYQPPQ